MTGPVCGAPADREGCRPRAIRRRSVGRRPDRHADSYGPDVAEELDPRSAPPHRPESPSPKAGLTRSGPDQWEECGRPDHLKAASARGVSVAWVSTTFDLFQLHRVDPRSPADEQFVHSGSSATPDGGRVGLSEVTVARSSRPGGSFPSSGRTVQPGMRGAKTSSTLRTTRDRFIPWFPLARGSSAADGGPVDTIARELEHRAPGVPGLALLVVHR